MTEYKTAGKGLRLMFLGALIAALGGFRIIDPVIGGIAAIAGTLLTLYGLYTAVPAHPYYKLAMMMELATMVLAVVLWVAAKANLLENVFSILNTLAALLSTVFVCSATDFLLKEKGDAPLAEQGRLIMLLYTLCAVVSILCILIAWIPVLNILAAITGAVTTVVMLAANIIKIFFYFKASRSLLA